MSDEVARALLEIDAVGFRVSDPVTFKSGIVSPVYCDNRKFPFHPAAWRVVIEGFAALIEREHIACDVLAGVEAAGIPHSAALGYAMRRPSVFVRKTAKEHGTKKRIEGGDVRGLRVVLVEDLVTTGGSSLAAVDALREEGAIVEDCLAIASYGFADGRKNFSAAGVKLHTLTTFDDVLREASAGDRITSSDADVVRGWLRDPWTARPE